MNHKSLYFRNVEIDEICEGLVRQYEGKAYGTRPINIVDFALHYFNMRIIYAQIAEEDANRLSFLADGHTPLKVLYDGRILEYVFPEKTIVLDRFLKLSPERCRRYFCIAHEIYHLIDRLLTGSPVAAAFHTEFDGEQHYTIEELSGLLNIRECQADRGAAALLMPAGLLKNTYMQFANGRMLSVYGHNVFSQEDKGILQRMAEYLGVSYTALVIRMQQMKMFEKHGLDEYISTELHLGTKEGG